MYLLELVDGDRLPVGLQGPPDREAVRFRALPSMNFPPSSIYSLGKSRVQPNGPLHPPPVMTVAFFGLTGPERRAADPLHPAIIKQLERGRGDERTALRDWLDLFNHRLTSLFYRSWEKYRFGVPFVRYLRARITRRRAVARQRQHDASQHRPASEAHRARSVYACALQPRRPGSPRLRNRLQVAVRLAEVPGDMTTRSIDHQRLAAIDDLALLYYSGLFRAAAAQRSALAAIIGDFFQSAS